MSVTITFQCETAVEAAVELLEFVALLTGAASETPAEPAPVVADDVENGAVRRPAPEEPKDAPAPKKRGRKPAAKAAEPEEAPQIRTKPEDRAPVEDAEIVEEEAEEETEEAVEEDDSEPATLDALKEAMSSYADKHGMAKAQTELPKLLGHARLSLVPEDEYAAAIARITEVL